MTFFSCASLNMGALGTPNVSILNGTISVFHVCPSRVNTFNCPPKVFDMIDSAHDIYTGFSHIPAVLLLLSLLCSLLNIHDIRATGSL